MNDKEKLVELGIRSFESEARKLNAEAAVGALTTLSHEHVEDMNSAEYRAMIKAVADMIESALAPRQ